MLRFVLLFLIVYLTPVILADYHDKPPTVYVDGKTVKDTYNTSAALPLGTTLVLRCEISGIASDLNRTYDWTCPNGPCEEKEKGYFGRMIKYNTQIHNNKTIISESILAINITSTRDNGTYTCTVYPEGRTEGFIKNFTLTVTGGKVVHSYGRLILNESVISRRRQLQPPDNPEGDGMIECRVSNGMAKFQHHGVYSDHVKRESDGSNATVDIKRETLRDKKFAIEGDCAGLYHYLFLRKDHKCCSLQNSVKIDSSPTSITVTIGELPDGIARAIVGYTRLDLGVPVEGEYVNLQACGSITFSSLEPGSKYRITAWGLSGGFNGKRKRCWSPTVEIRSLEPCLPSSPRGMTVTQSAAGMELNWMAPRYPNGDITHYMVKFTKEGTLITDNALQNYYALDSESKYTNITVMAVNKAGTGPESKMMREIPARHVSKINE